MFKGSFSLSWINHISAFLADLNTLNKAERLVATD